jgi:solute carrier family 25 carnitine/acylcarnitine transporter 20/29
MSAASIENGVPPIPPLGTSASAHNGSKEEPAHYKGFVAGVFSGIAKLTVGHPYASILHAIIERS